MTSLPLCTGNGSHPKHRPTYSSWIDRAGGLYGQRWIFEKEVTPDDRSDRAAWRPWWKCSRPGWCRTFWTIS